MKIKTAVVGVGTFGKQHARALASFPNADLVGIVDTDPGRASQVAAEFDCRAFSHCSDLHGLVEAAVVAVPTRYHTEVGLSLLEEGIDLLMEKPIAPDLDSADKLISTARRNKRVLQVGHLERFNPVVEAAHAMASLPLFFEVHRMSPFSSRSLDVDVILDLMIHDLDIVLNMVDSAIERFEATGVPILSPKADIASVRLVFQNGCVANLTASRISVERIRKLRFFQPRQYISIDYTRQDGSVFTVGGDRRIEHRPIQVQKGEPLVRQNESFLQSVALRGEPRVPGEAARNSLELALRIEEEIGRHSRLVAETIAAEQL